MNWLKALITQNLHYKAFYSMNIYRLSRTLLQKSSMIFFYSMHLKFMYLHEQVQKYLTVNLPNIYNFLSPASLFPESVYVFHQADDAGNIAFFYDPQWKYAHFCIKKFCVLSFSMYGWYEQLSQGTK